MNGHPRPECGHSCPSGHNCTQPKRNAAVKESRCYYHDKVIRGLIR